MVYADGVGNDAGARDGWYAAFKISNDGEDLHLADPDGRLSVSLRVPALRKNESYGRAADGGEAFATLTPTPGASNDGSALTIAASVLSFSHESGFYADPFSLSVTAPDGYRVYYTTDCSDPAVSALALNVLRIGILTAPFISLYYLISSFLQASGQAGKALTVSILRQGAVLIPTLMILGNLFELTGIFWSSFTSDLISTAAASVILLAGKKKAAVKAVA